jgi:hypothetical protein
LNRGYNQNIPDEQRDRRGRRSERGRMSPQEPGMEGRSMIPPYGTPPSMTPPPSFTVPEAGMEGMPRMAPPNFIPEPPGMERRSAREPGRGQGREPIGYEFIIPGTQPRIRDLRRCVNNFTFIWLRNGNSFWFYPTFIDNQFVRGFRWRRNRWEFDFINLNRIIYFRCF